MRKQYFVGLLLVSLTVTPHARPMNPDHVKIGVSGGLALLLAGVSFGCFRHVSNLEVEERELFFEGLKDSQEFRELVQSQSFYKKLAWLCAGGAVASGSYCGYKIYDLYQPKSPTPDPQVVVVNPDTNPQPVVLDGAIITEMCHGLRKENMSPEFYTTYHCYEQRVLPTINTHLKDHMDAFANGDAQKVVDCYQACVGEIEKQNFDHLAGNLNANEKAKFNEERREAMGNMLNDHMSSLLVAAWQGNGYEGIITGLEGLKQPGQRNEKDIWLESCRNKIRDMAYQRDLKLAQQQQALAQARRQEEQRKQEEARKKLEAEALRKQREEAKALEKCLADNEKLDRKFVEIAKFGRGLRRREALKDFDFKMLGVVNMVQRVLLNKVSDNRKTKIQDIQIALGTNICPPERAERILNWYDGNGN